MRNRIPRVSSLLILLAVVAAACSGDPSGLANGHPDGRSGFGRSRAGGAHPLVPFGACDSFLDYVISHGVELVGPYGLGSPIYPYFLEEQAMDGAARAAVPTTAAASGEDFSGTNNQVLGVDEPDMVKTDGRRILVLSEGTLLVADVTGPEPVVTGRLQLGEFAVQSLFLAGDKALLFGAGSMPVTPLVDPAEAADSRFAPYPMYSPTVQLVEVALGGEPEIVRTMTIDGSFLSARMVEDTVRLVMSSSPVGFEWEYPTGSGLQAEREATEANREIIERSKPENWIPYYIVTDADGRVTSEGTLFPCHRAAHPEEFSGLDMLSIVTIDVGSGLDVTDATGTLATGQTIYASADNLYVATQSWQAWQWGMGTVPEGQPDEITTDIHKFDISRSEASTYVASGQVEGFLLNQFSMDEHDGLLRVATTSSPTWWGEGDESESLVTILEEQGGELAEIGSVGDLGRTEQIYSVRFMGDIAYVVTFRQTDPLYTIDLSNPVSPQVAGELKILGYSAYLHPIRDGLLLGVGQDATEEGQVKGTQVSVFDVSDPAAPTRVDQFTLSEGSSSQVEYDHHAFLYWEPTGLTMLPFQQWSWDGTEKGFLGAVGLTVDADGKIEETRRLAHPGGDIEDYRAQILRSIVIGEDVYTISAKGIMKSDLATLQEETWLGF
jgi:Beta propeller domain